VSQAPSSLAALAADAPIAASSGPGRASWLAKFRRLQGLLVPAILVVVWEAVVRAGWISPHLMPPPTEIIATYRDLAADGSLFSHIAISTARVAVGFAIGGSLAIVIGATLGLSRRLEALFDPTFQALRAIPSLAWVPLLLLWLGIDEGPKITLIAIGAFFPIYLGLVAGIHNVDRKLVEVGEIYGLGGFRLIRRIFLPAALPSLFTGIRTGLSLSWMFLVAAELIAASRGLGYLLTDGRETGRADVVIVSIITLALLGKFSDSLLRVLEQRLLSWRDVYASR
jgi:sulfonate transport system permease protein